MSMIDVLQRGIGVRHEGNEIKIDVWAPLAKKAAICIYAGDREQNRIPLVAQERGYWTAQVKVDDHVQYKFQLDDGDELPDPVSMYQPEDVHGSSRTFDATAFAWTDNAWKNPALQDYIFYELHTGTFTEQGTFLAIEEKLDYLLDLGITAIEIMPVAQFPGNRNWGYDGVFPYAVQASYGGPERLQHLVNKCHEKGLAVVLDTVYNHLGPEGNYLTHYGPYFTDKYKTPWGNAINFDDAHSDEVRRYFIENALMWFRDFHIDALRLDAVHAIKDLSAQHILKDIKLYTDELGKATGRSHYLIVECDLNDTRYIDGIAEKGYGMDSQWTDEFHHALRVAAGNERTGYYADFNGLTDLAKAYRDGYVYTGIYSEERARTFGTQTDGKPGHQFITFSQNHDQVGNRMLGERTSHLLSFEMQKLVAAAVMVSPYLPLLFMGEEWAAPFPFQYFISHSEQELIDAVCEGRKKEFAAFHAEGEVPDPQAEDTFNGSKLQWQLMQQQPHDTMLRYYKALITLRKTIPALHLPNREQLDVATSLTQQLLMLHRWQADGHIVCLMNFSKEIQYPAIPFNTGELRKIFNSADSEWGGPAAADENSGRIILQPESIMIYTSKHV